MSLPKQIGQLEFSKFEEDSAGRVAVRTVLGSGWSVFNATSGDTYTALTNSAQSIKNLSGQLGGYYMFNPNADIAYVMVYNQVAANVTVGTTVAKMIFAIPAGAAANVEIGNGIPFDTALSCAAATTAAGNGAPTTPLEVMFYYK